MTARNSSAFRIQRSELAVPATSARFFAKAAASPADAVFLDLEDAVAPHMKDEARAAAVRALKEHDWGGKTMVVRINALDTRWAFHDIVDLATHAPRLDLILAPKISGADDIRFIDRLLSLLEQQAPRAKPIGVEALIETAKGVAHVEEIAASSERLEALIFGVGDYSVDMRTQDRVFGKTNPNYAMDGDTGTVRHVNDQWHFALARIANACRAYGLRPIDGPFADFGDVEGYRASAERSRALGFEGKWAIHPSQVALANEIYSPTADELSWAENIFDVLDKSNRQGNGAVAFGGVLIDMAHHKVASYIVDRAKRIAQVSSSNGGAA
jgi:malyl-CoA/(S)-citramalyl-CoA lyase